MHNRESLSHIRNAEIYLINNGIDPDTLAPADIARIQEELKINPCEITFTKSESTHDTSTVTEEGEALVEEFFGRFSITPDEAPAIIRSMAENIAIRALSSAQNNCNRGFVNSTELMPEAEFEL